jgi:hypothetical protein
LPVPMLTSQAPLHTLVVANSLTPPRRQQQGKPLSGSEKITGPCARAGL